MRLLYIWLVFCSATIIGLLHHRAYHRSSVVPRDTLVIYLYHPTDVEHKTNLLYFLKAGIKPADNCQYAIVIAPQTEEYWPEAWPRLPESAQYVFQPAAHPPRACSAWGQLGWFLQEAAQEDYLAHFRYFMVVSSTHRGPFLPLYLQPAMHWTQPFVRRLNHRVKMVGPTISCEGAPAGGNPDGPWRRNPHIPMSAFATDSLGLQVLLSSPEVLRCYANQWDATYYSELGASRALLGAGYGLDSLMIRYQGVDWRNNATWDCNGRWDPTQVGDFPNDGVSPGPMELVFVPVTSHSLDVAQPAAVAAQQYAAWTEAALDGSRRSEDIAANRYASNKARYKLPRVLIALVRGLECFDAEFFKRHNPDFVANFKGTLTAARAWAFYVYYGQFEDRPFRYTCPANWSRVTTPAF